MSVIVPIHNLINELAWRKIIKWEQRYAETCKQGPTLKSFQGRPDEPSPRARFNNMFMGRKTFDRHDWVVDRCGQEVTYILDFYNLPAEDDATPFNIDIDVRPSLWSASGVYQRFMRFYFE